MTFRRGMQKVAGRVKGTPNKLTANFREAVLLAYDRIGGHATFTEWARQNPTEFFRICARLIPTELPGSEKGGVTVIIARNERVSPPPVRDSRPEQSISATRAGPSYLDAFGQIADLEAEEQAAANGLDLLYSN